MNREGNENGRSVQPWPEHPRLGSLLFLNLTSAHGCSQFQNDFYRLLEVCKVHHHLCGIERCRKDAQVCKGAEGASGEGWRVGCLYCATCPVEHSSATVDQQFALIYFDISKGFPHHCLGWVCPVSISIQDRFELCAGPLGV